MGDVKRSWVGLDLGTTSIKLISLRQGPAGITVHTHLVQDRPGDQPAQPDDLANALRVALRQFPGKRLHVAMGGPEVVVRRTILPCMEKEGLVGAATWQIKDQLPCAVQDAVVDVMVLGDILEKDVKKYEVLVAAAPRSLIDGLMTTVERAGGSVASLTPAAFAMWRAIDRLMPQTSHGSWVLVDWGARTTHVIISDQGQLQLVRELPLGSDHVTDALVGEVSAEHGRVVIDRAMAERLNRRYGIAHEAEGATKEGIPLFYVASLIRPVLERLLTEIGRCIDFYKLQAQRDGVERLLLCGGGANMNAVQSFLAQGVGVPVDLWNPLLTGLSTRAQLSDHNTLEDGYRLTVAAGVALDHGQSLNLLPLEVKQARAASVRRGRLNMMAQIATIGLLALGLWCWGLFAHLERQIHQQQLLWSQVKPRYEEYLQVASTTRMLERTMANVQRLLDRQPIWDGVFKELSVLVPPTIHLAELRVNTTENEQEQEPTMHLELDGTIEGDQREGVGPLAPFLEALERSMFFRQVTLGHSEVHADQTGTAIHVTSELE